MKPYSSISFFRSSSAAFRALRFFHKNSKPRISRTMAAIGTMTAMAIIPPEDNPLDFDDVAAPAVASADDLVDEDEAVPEEAEE